MCCDGQVFYGSDVNKCITAHRTYLVASNDVKVISGEKKIGILISYYALFHVIFGTIHILRQLSFYIFDTPLQQSADLKLRWICSEAFVKHY